MCAGVSLHESQNSHKMKRFRWVHAQPVLFTKTIHTCSSRIPCKHCTQTSPHAWNGMWMEAAQLRAFRSGVIYHNCEARNTSWNLHFSHIWNRFQLKASSLWNRAPAAPEFNTEHAGHNFQRAPSCDRARADRSNPAEVLRGQDVSECSSPNKGE